MPQSAFKKIATFICFLLVIKLINAQIHSVANAHSHNDYENKTPFFLAYQKGFGSIEADVFPEHGILCVAHNKRDVNPEISLTKLYLTPLAKEFATRPRKLNLLIDIKENHKEALRMLLDELAPLKQWLSTLEKPNYLTIIISGDRPPPAMYKEYPVFIFFDSDLQRQHDANEWKRVALVSLPFNKITSWNGKEKLTQADRKRLTRIIDSSHSAGKPIRFWAAPDTRASWKLQVKLKANFIGTDKISELATFLARRKKT